MTYTSQTSPDTCSWPPLPQTKNLDQTSFDPSETKKLNEIKDLYSVVEVTSEDAIVVVNQGSDCCLYSVVNHNDQLTPIDLPSDLFYKVYWGGIDAILIVELVNLDLLQWESLYNSVLDCISHNGGAEGP